jgi:hypothetical protein
MILLLALLLAVLFVAVFVVLPIKISATWVGAERTGWLPCLFAGILCAVIGAIANGLVRHGAVASVFISGAVFMLVLGTTYVRGLIVAVLEIVLTYAFVAVLFLTAVAPKLLKLLGHTGAQI